MQEDKKLRDRLEKIWEPSDFFLFFEKYSKQPPRKILKRTVLFNPGDPLSGIYFIKEGFIKLYRVSQDGKEDVIYLTGPGDLLGLRALISKDQHARHCTEALTDVKIYTMSRKELFDILSKQPEYMINFIHAFIKRLNHAEQRLKGFISADATSRVAIFLNDLVSRFGCQKQGQIDLPLSLTHQRIAEFVGSVRETVTEAFQELEKEKVLINKRGKITILNLKKLKEYSSLEE